MGRYKAFHFPMDLRRQNYSLSHLFLQFLRHLGFSDARIETHSFVGYVSISFHNPTCYANLLYDVERLEVTLCMFNQTKTTAEDIRYLIAGTFSCPAVNISLLQKNQEQVECQEQQCIRKATNSWNGLMVCRDHYEQYQQQHFNDIADMDEI